MKIARTIVISSSVRHIVHYEYSFLSLFQPTHWRCPSEIRACRPCVVPTNSVFCNDVACLREQALTGDGCRRDGQQSTGYLGDDWELTGISRPPTKWAVLAWDRLIRCIHLQFVFQRLLWPSHNTSWLPGWRRRDAQFTPYRHWCGCRRCVRRLGHRRGRRRWRISGWCLRHHRTQSRCDCTLSLCVVVKRQQLEAWVDDGGDAKVIIAYTCCQLWKWTQGIVKKKPHSLLVFELEPMYATSDRRTDDGRRWPPNAPASPTGAGA